MSNDALYWAWRQNVTGTGAKILLVALADFADESWSCYPGQQRLADMTGMSPRAVRDNLDRLEAAGLVRRFHRYSTDHRGRTSDRYVLQRIPEDSAAKKSEVVLPADPDVLPADPDVLPADFVRSTGKICQGTIREPSEEPPEEPSGGARKRARTAHRLPDDWQPSQELITWALAEVPELAGPRGRAETAKFKDHWLAAAGANARKRDWSAAWRNWMRKAADSMPPAVTSRRQQETDQWFARAMARAQARERIGDSDGNGGALPQGQGVLPPAGHG